MLSLAAEAQDVKLQADFNLADTYIVVSGPNQKKVSRFQLRFLRLRFHHLGSKFQIPISELYKQIMEMSPAEKVSSVCHMVAGFYVLFFM